MNFNSRRLFLSSNSVYKNLNYLEHTLGDMVDFLSGAQRIVFVPFASVARKGSLTQQWDEYAASPRKAFSRYNIDVESLHNFPDKPDAVRKADAIFIGGGNTHHLLFWLNQFGLMEPIREMMIDGTPMLGSSAGSNIFCPTICTTNDMPIVSNPSFNAINAVPFQINPHYLDPDPNSDHRGETREQRINEFLKVSDFKVLGLREGAWLRIESGTILLKGLSAARLFVASDDPVELDPTEEGLDITKLLLDAK